MRIYMISGQAQHGKTTTAKLLAERLEGRTMILPFAKYLKRYLIDYYGWDGVTKDEKYRDLLQQLGTDVIREGLNKKAFHVNRIIEDIDIMTSPLLKENKFDNVIIDDWRMQNEVYGILKAFGKENVTLIRVYRQNFESPLTEEQQQHITERDLDEFYHYDWEIICGSGINNIVEHLDNRYHVCDKF